MCVSDRHLNGFVPHEFLEGCQAHVLIRFVCAEGVTQRMHTSLLANPSPLDVLGNRIFHR